MTWWQRVWRSKNVDTNVDPADMNVRATAGTKGLYVVRVDFPLSDPELRQRLEENLERLRADYPGLDFFVIEPGITLSRFDAI
ncbi:MAG: hypothetical protein LAQ69_22525 [Acidobacteriia bacterium]|nr:hypothetical protein [Terriglobia bacterium]